MRAADAEEPGPMPMSLWEVKPNGFELLALLGRHLPEVLPPPWRQKRILEELALALAPFAEVLVQLPEQRLLGHLGRGGQRGTGTSKRALVTTCSPSGAPRLLVRKLLVALVQLSNY